MEKENYAPIGDYGIVGNCQTVALVHRLGSVDFMCFPNFDSPTVFAALLDKDKGGSFHTRPQMEPTKTTQQYLLDTNVLLTRYFSDAQTVDIIDFMPISDEKLEKNQFMRLIRAVRGNGSFQLHLNPRPDYGQTKAQLQKVDTQFLRCPLGDEGTLDLCASVPLFSEGDALKTSFELKEGERAVFVLGDAPQEVKNLEDFAEARLRETLAYWRKWLSQCQYEGDFSDAVKRSALTLKLLTSGQYGSTVAAATFSLPEQLGGDRNYDYRFTWIRDAAFTMYAFMRMGLFSEAKDFMAWILACIKDDINGGVKLQIMYRLDGTKDLEERELNLEGYRGSRPVRIGNAATQQIQLDIFGELLDTIYIYDKYGEPITYSFWQHIEQLLEFVCKNWNTADHGIWEVRETKRHYLYTRVMCWVALERAITLVRKRAFPTDLERWIKNRNLIHQDIYDHFWNGELQSFVHFKGANTVDSSLLIMPLVHFISPYDDKWKKTLKAIEQQLVQDVLVYRNMEDSAPLRSEKKEGSFLVGAFWYVECLARGGELEKATHYFQKLLGHGNHLGLFAEEMDPAGRQLGNFPQAFTHLGLISAAFNLHRQKHKANYIIDQPFSPF
ncbi:glycoside hydrolase family 15 protein [Maribacter sp. 2307ULW6-5]|uniref:glycoside hydrolase family 15 protein n=1 Tax=Maribacter sp. 2307ULW6-5 TaxID=3386275 RepID=UPI0039BD3515